MYLRACARTHIPRFVVPMRFEDLAPDRQDKFLAICKQASVLHVQPATLGCTDFIAHAKRHSPLQFPVSSVFVSIPVDNVTTFLAQLRDHVPCIDPVSLPLYAQVFQHFDTVLQRKCVMFLSRPSDMMLLACCMAGMQVQIADDSPVPSWMARLDESRGATATDSAALSTCLWITMDPFMENPNALADRVTAARATLSTGASLLIVWQVHNPALEPDAHAFIVSYIHRLQRETRTLKGGVCIELRSVVAPEDCSESDAGGRLVSRLLLQVHIHQGNSRQPSAVALAALVRE